jgi:hypothetical protein
LRQVHSLFQTFGKGLSRKSTNVVVFPFAFHNAVQQPLKPPWSRLLLCDHEPSRTSTVLCFMSLLMSLLPASGEFVSEFPSPRVNLSFFPHPRPYRLGWLYQDLKLPPASLSESWGILGPPTTSREGCKKQFIQWIFVIIFHLLLFIGMWHLRHVFE